MTFSKAGALGLTAPGALPGLANVLEVNARFDDGKLQTALMHNSAIEIIGFYWFLLVSSFFNIRQSLT